jgi:anaerobic magnesium-protoporphyrin IX monomethyl ester cyclase
MDKIILFTVNDKKSLYSLTEGISAIQPNIGMGLLDSYLESKGIKVELIDETFNYSISEMVGIIEKEQPVLFGVICSGANPSASTMSMVGAIKFFKGLGDRKGNSKGFIQGGHPSVLPKRTLEETGADYLIRGEGYKAIEQLYRSLINSEEYPNIEGLAYIRDGEYINACFPKLIDVKELPMVNWEKMNPNKYRAHNWHSFEDINHRSPYGVIWTSLGCPHNCSFCCTNNVFGQRAYRMRDMQEVLKEIDVLVTQYGVKHIKILDELFVINHPRIEEFYQGLKRRKYDLNMWCYARTDSVNPVILEKLRSVGVKWIAYGIESTSQKVLGDITKGCNKDFYDSVIEMTRNAGMYFGIDIIAGLWLDDKSSLEDTYQWCVSHNFEWLNMYPAFALPGTKLYDDCIKDGRREEPKDWDEYSLYGYNCYPLNSKYLSREEILVWRDSKFIEYYSRPEYLDMMELKFGIDTRNHLIDMTKHKLPRRILCDLV